MITPLLSPREIISSIEKVTSVTELFKDVRKGRWNAALILNVVDQLEQDIAERQNEGSYKIDEDYGRVLGLLSIIFASKDKFSYDYDINSEEYLAVLRLHGRLMAALGV